MGDFAPQLTYRRRIKNSLKRMKPTSLIPPLRPGLRQEILDLESRKSDWNISELKDFPELRESAWTGLASLAYEIVRTHKPKVVVELGTHMGLSALAMGLALRDLNEGGTLYAVDTWQGDPQAGFYDDSVYNTFMQRRATLGLDGVVVPLRMTFDEALDRVPAAIDLLHCDGLHTWEAVNHDFTTYRPKVRPGGIVIFHDMNTVFAPLRRFWKRLTHRYEHYLVPYSHGLGIIRLK